MKEGDLMKCYIATFGANQKHEGYYLEIICNSYEEAYEYMETRYARKYCMIYPKESWDQQVEKFDTLGYKLEQKMDTIRL